MLVLRYIQFVHRITNKIVEFVIRIEGLLYQRFQENLSKISFILYTKLNITV